MIVTSPSVGFGRHRAPVRRQKRDPSAVFFDFVKLCLEVGQTCVSVALLALPTALRRIEFHWLNWLSRSFSPTRRIQSDIAAETVSSSDRSDKQQASRSVPQKIVGLIVRLSPLGRRLLLMSVDALIVALAVGMSFPLGLIDASGIQMQEFAWLLPAALSLALPLYVFGGQYKSLVRYTGSRALYQLVARNVILVLVLAGLGLLAGVPMPARSSWMLFGLLITAGTGFVRFMLRDLLLAFHHRLPGEVKPVVIYGAGAAGAQLQAALRLGNQYKVVAFVDDDPSLSGRMLAGAMIYSAHLLPQLLRRLEVQQVLLAIPSLSRLRHRSIVDALQKLDVAVMQVPGIDEIAAGRARIDTLRPIPIEELLGRDPVCPNVGLLGPGITGRVVLVSGAGGSIGSELCRQVVALAPRRLILLENSEPSLYAIDQELRPLLQRGTELTAMLGSVGDLALMRNILPEVQVVFHAAAYKHVPLVEMNPLAGLANNVIGTRTFAQAAAQAGVESFTLISTDKAVRPTNVMGASKRVCELILQALAVENPGTCFSMVRFGNVLGSSGSVVPLFRRQIAAGGPITLTHPDIVRYFMTIPEAVQLVMQAAAMARGGECFLLDMGEPVKIRNLAEQMVRLSGLSLCDESHPEGDIEIRYVGLRPGEKLYEELLIDAEAQPTDHPLIFCANENSMPADQLWPRLNVLAALIAQHNVKSVLALMHQLVPEWKPDLDLEPVEASSMKRKSTHLKLVSLARH